MVVIGMIDLVAYIEVQSNEREMVRPALEKVVRDMEDEGVEVVRSEIGEILESEDDTYSSVLEVELSIDLRGYVKMAMIYSPTAIHVMEGEMTLEKKELLEILGDISNMTRKIMEEFQMIFQVRSTDVGGASEAEEEFTVTFFCEVQGNEQKIREQAGLVFADSRARVGKMRMRKADGALSLLAIEGYFPDPESLFETTAKMTPVAFATELERVELSMRDIQVIGMTLSSLTAEIATKKISMDF